MTLRQKKLLFSRNYSDVFDVVYRYVCVRVRDRSDAEDVVSETFLQAYTRLSEFDPEQGNLRQWLIGIAKNKMLMYWRSKKTFVDLESLEEIIGGNERVAEQVGAKLELERIFDQLSEKERVLMIMRYVDQMTHEEIAEAIDKQPDAVRKYFSRLIQRLESYA